MIRRPPRSTLFPYTTLFRSPVFDNQPCISMGELAIAPSDTLQVWAGTGEEDRKSTRLNSSHDQISYAVFCLKKKKSQGAHRQATRCSTCSCHSYLDCTQGNS